MIVIVIVLGMVPMDVVTMEPEVIVEAKGHSTTVVLILKVDVSCIHKMLC